MKRLLASALACLAFVACGVSDTLRTGDLLFVAYPPGVVGDGMDQAISVSTGDGKMDFVHAAIVEVEDGEPYVIDATIRYGVHRHHLDTLVKQFTMPDGTAPVLVFKRLKDDSGAEAFVSRAKEFIGEEYDSCFLPDNGKHYCTELIYDSYIRDGKRIFSSAPMNWKGPDGEYPKYWVDLFAYIGQPIPQGVEGTNPQDMSGDAALITLNIR